MFKNKKSKLNKKVEVATSKKLFTPLNQKEQQTISGGGRRGTPGSPKFP